MCSSSYLDRPAASVNLWECLFLRPAVGLMSFSTKLYQHCPIIRAMADPFLFLWRASVEVHCPRNDCLSDASSKEEKAEKQEDCPTADHEETCCCPRRRARSWKCAKRASRRRHHQQGHDECPLTTFYKCHLPAPLPFWRRRRPTVVEEHISPPSCDDTSDDDGSLDNASTSQNLSDNASVSQNEKNTSSTLATGEYFQEEPYKTMQDISVADVVVVAHPPKLPRRKRALLIDLVRMQQWEVILNESLKRREAKYRDADGLYPLHWAAAGNPPLAVMERLMDLYPSAIRRADREGSLPLHFAACYGASMDVISQLIKQYPEALTRQDRYGRTAFYHCTDKASQLSVLQLLSQDHPQVVTTPCSPRSKKTTSDAVHSARQVAMRTPLYLMWTKVLSDRQTRSTYQGKTWDKAVWMLQVAHRHLHGDKSSESLLIATLRMDIYLPDTIVSLIISARPDLLRVPNPIMPLSEAAGNRSYSLARWERLVELLLKANPAAARTLPTPFHQAIRVGRPFALFIRTTPEATAWRDSINGLPPALLAASVSTAIEGLECQEDDEPSSDAAIWSSRASDPFKLLPPKQRERLDRQASISASNHKDGGQNMASEDQSQLENIYTLLRANPLQVIHT